VETGGFFIQAGGGRMAVIVTSSNAFTGSMTAYGANFGGSIVPAGTIYLEQPPQASGKGQLIIDNNGYATSSGYDTVISTLRGCTDAAMPPRYPPVMAGELMRAKMEARAPAG